MTENVLNIAKEAVVVSGFYFEGLKRSDGDRRGRLGGLQSDAIQLRFDPGPAGEYAPPSSPEYFYLQLRDVCSI